MSVGKVAGKPVSAGTVSLSASRPVTVDIPISRMPEGYPSNGTLQTFVVDPATGATVATANVNLEPEGLKKRSDGASVFEVSLPALTRSGSLVLAAKLTSEVSGDKGARQVLSSPVTCSTEVVQPAKARCRAAWCRFW